LFTAMTGIFTPAYSVSKRTGSDGGHGVACTRVYLGQLLGDQGHAGEAVDLIERSLDSFERRGDDRWAGKALIALGIQMTKAGQVGTARQAFRSALDRLRRIGAAEAEQAAALLEPPS
jgi:hypothetical protein